MSEQTSQPPPADELAEAHELIMALIEGDIEPAQIARLDDLVRGNDQVLRLYSIYVHQHCVVAAIARPVAVDAPDVHQDEEAAVGGPTNGTFVAARPREEATQGQSREPTDGAAFRLFRQFRSSGRWAAVLLLGIIGIVVGLMLQQQSHQRANPQLVVSAPSTQPIHSAQPGLPEANPRSIAKFSRGIRAQWDTALASPAAGDDIPTETALSLRAGFAEFTFSNGAIAVIEAPASFRLRSASLVALDSGKLAATVPPPAHGFTVATHLCTITDLGTEFGVAAAPGEFTQIDVFKGEVTAQPSTGAAPTPLTLLAGNTTTITPTATKTDPRGAMPQRFVRTLKTNATALDVVDLLCGGDGTTHLRGASIDPRSGDFGHFPARTGPGNLYGDNRYHSVSLPVVSGSFIPNGPTQIDPANFASFTNTHGDTYDLIRAGGPVNFPSQPQFSAHLGGVDYLSPDHSLVLLHSNAGLTLDLGAVRRLHPGKTLVRFHTTLGNCAPASGAGNKPVAPVPADAYIFIDGTPCFEKHAFTNREGPFEVDLHLQDSDRYLTFATCTDSTSPTDDTIWFNWIILGDAQFQFAD
jgi:hypothetical protein